jgi:hypothetical protein
MIFPNSNLAPNGSRIGLPGSSALQNDGLIVPAILQCRNHWETNPNNQWEPTKVLRKSIFSVSPWWSWYVLGPSM